MPVPVPPALSRPADLLMAVGVVHLLSAPLLQPGLRPLLADGLVDAVHEDPSREAAVWFVVSGIGVVALGDVGRTSLREHGHLPPRYAAYVLAAGALIAATMPTSPGWVVAALGAWAARRG